MRQFHICNVESKSGIARYASDFQQAVLAQHGYELIQPEVVTRAWIHTQPADVVFHLQLGAKQFAERRAMSRLIRSGRPNIDATLHDPPFLTFPYFSFPSRWAMRMSRGFDWYLNSLGIQGRALRRLRRIFVLSKKGALSLARYRPREIVVMPHIVCAEQISQHQQAMNNDIVFFGFISPNKGIEYALRLHSRIRIADPTIRLHIVGEASGCKEEVFFAELKEKYQEGVVYHGYVPDEQLDTIFAMVRHAFLPFDPYRFLNPASGSVVNALKRGRIVWTTPVNTVPELIIHGHNGLMLTKDLEQDVHQFLSLIQEPSELDRIAAAALDSAWSMCRYPYAGYFASVPTL